MPEPVDWTAAIVGLLAVIAIAAGYVLIQKTGQPLPYAGIVPVLAGAIAFVAVATGRSDLFVAYVGPLLALWVLWLLLPRICGPRWRESATVPMIILAAPLLVIAINAIVPLWPEALWGPVTVTAMWVGAVAAGVIQAARGCR